MHGCMAHPRSFLLFLLFQTTSVTLCFRPNDMGPRRCGLEHEIPSQCTHEKHRFKVHCKTVAVAQTPRQARRWRWWRRWRRWTKNVLLQRTSCCRRWFSKKSVGKRKRNRRRDQSRENNRRTNNRDKNNHYAFHRRDHDHPHYVAFRHSSSYQHKSKTEQSHLVHGNWNVGNHEKGRGPRHSSFGAGFIEIIDKPVGPHTSCRPWSS